MADEKKIEEEVKKELTEELGKELMMIAKEKQIEEISGFENEE